MYKNKIIYTPVVTTQCTGCGKCIRLCRQQVLKLVNEMNFPRAWAFEADNCNGYEECQRKCPNNAIRIMITEIINPLNQKTK